MFKKLPKSFYLNPNTEEVGRNLLGKYLITDIDGHLTGGMITETESYLGREDLASHSYGGRFTERTKVMYHSGGVAYVYLCYGIHYLLNIITHEEGEPHGILIRSIRPEIGVEVMKKRRKNRLPIASGPGNVTQSLGVNSVHNGLDLQGDTIWIEDRNVHIPKKDISISPRIGIDYAKDWVEKPLRFYIKD